MKTYPPSQEEVVAAFLKAFNGKRGTRYEVVARPDEVERTLPDIDYILRDDAHPPEVAVEVSSTWRSEDAGKEDADWWIWVQGLREDVRGRLPGRFRVSTPMRIPPRLAVEPFADALVEVAHRERERLAQLHLEGKGAYFSVCDVRVFLSYAGGDGSDIGFGRILSDEDGQELPEHVKRLVAKKSPKLRPHKEAGRETWLVVYNTFWTAMSPVKVRDIVLAALGPEHCHVDHFGIIAGDPPDDAWLDIIR